MRSGETTGEYVRRLQSVTDAALAHLQLEELLNALLHRTREILDVDTCAVLLLDEETSELVARAALGIEEEVEQGVRIPFGGGFAGRIAAEKRPVILEDVDRSDVVNPILVDKGIKSMLGVPLVVGGEVLGVLHVGSLVPREFEPDEVELLQLVADRAALAIEHARLFEAERAARERIENVQVVTDAALSQLEVDELLKVLLPRIREMLHTDTCAVLLLDERTNELVARAALGIEEEVEQGVRVPVGAGFAGRVAADGRPLLIDVDEYDVWNPILREKGIKSMLGVPLLVRGFALGVLHVGSLSKREFSAGEVELLQLVAERVAIAIERARLHEEIVQLDQLKLNFVAIASHELRTPATAVYGVLRTLAERELSDELRDELTRVGAEQADRLRRLLEELLDLSRLDERAISVDPRPILLRAALIEVVVGAAPLSEGVEVEVPDDLGAVVDPLVLERVVTNLVVNALRYGTPPIRVTAERRDGHLRVAVEDSGPGVPKELERRLFDRFARAGGGSGHGLGLAIARAYAKAHGGDLVYDARRRGARFELIIPQLSAEARG